MTRELPEVLNELFRFGSVTEKVTEEFKDMKHNADLCPAVTQQLNRLLESYLKYDAVAYDVQGLHDQGTDILLKYYPNPDGEDNSWYAIAIQIKSYDDLKKPDYVKDLRSQRLQADDEFGDKLVQYVVMLCTSSSEHKARIREATKALSKIDKTLVMVPEFCLKFIRLRESQIRATVDSFQKGDDVVLDRARGIVAFVPPLRVAAMLWAIDGALHDGPKLSIDDAVGDPFLESVVAAVEADEVYDEELGEFVTTGSTDDAHRIKESVDALIGDTLQVDDDDHSLRVGLTTVRPIQALLLELEVRYETHGRALLEHAFELLGVAEAWDLEFEAEGGL